MTQMLSTQEAEIKSNEKVSSQEFARLAKRKVILGAVKVKGRWQLPEDSVDIYIHKIRSELSLAGKLVDWWERTARVPPITIALLILGLLVNSLDFFLNISSLFDIVLPGVTLYVDRAKEDELLILVTEFSGTGDYDPTSRIYRVLDEAIKERNLHTNEDLRVQIKRVPNSPNISEDARKLGERYRATMVIWGTFDNASIEPRVEILSQYDWQKDFPSLGEFINSDVYSYNLYLAQGLPTELEFLSLLVVSKSLLLQDRYDEAILLLDSALEFDLTDREESFVKQVYATRGQAFFDLGDFAKAENDFAIAIEQGYTNGAIYNNFAILKSDQEEFDEALGIIEQGLELYPDFSFILHNTKGTILYRQRNYEDAVLSYTTALNNVLISSIEIPDEALAGAYSNRGSAYNSLDDYENAKADYLQAQKLFPDYPGVFHNLGNLELENQNPEEALEYFNKALALGTDDPRTIQLRGVAYRSMGDFENARLDFESTIEQAPDYGGGYYEMGVLEILEENYRQAEIQLEKALEIWPDNIRTMEELFFAYVKTGNKEKMHDVLEELINVEDEEIKYRYLELRGQQYMYEGDLTHAKEDFLRVLEYDPDNIDALYGVGISFLYIDQKLEKAVEIFNLLETIEPNYSELYLMRGAAQYLLGNGEAARQGCSQFIDLIETNGIHVSDAIACGIVQNAQFHGGYAIFYKDGTVEILTP